MLSHRFQAINNWKMNAYGTWDISRIMASWGHPERSHGGLTINGVLVAVGSLWPITRIQKQI
jgi:hypothetical protein